MKRMMCITTVCLALLPPAMASAAEGNLNSSVRGDYAFSGSGSCIGTGKGFDADGRALFPANNFSQSVEGVRHFDGDGTGTVRGRSVTIVNGGNPIGLGPATAETFSAEFTYTVARDRSIHIENGPLTSTQIVGPDRNSSSVWHGIRIDGHVSQDFKTIVVATAAPNPDKPELVLEYRYKNDNVKDVIVQTHACSRSRVMVRIGSGNGRDD